MRMLRLLPILLFALIGTAYVIWSWSTVLGGFGGDNAHYLFMARHFSPYSVESAVTAHFAANSIYPPLFPLLLGLVGGGESLLAAHLATTSFLLAAFGVFYWWLRLEGLGMIAACVTLLALVLLPGVYLQTLSVHSENLYLLCSLAALACASVARREKTAYPWMAWAIVALAAAYLTRGAGLALVVAWLAWLWLNRMPQRMMFSILAILPIILWSQFGSTNSTNYWAQLTNGYHDPSAFFSQVWVQSQYLLGGWLANFGSSRTAFITGTLILSLGLIAALWRTKLRHMDGLYVWCYLGMAVLWPFPAESQRMVVVLFPILLWQSVWMLGKWKLESSNIQPLRIGLLVILLLSALPEFALNVQRFHSPLPSEVPQAYRHTEGWYSPNSTIAISDVKFTAALESDLLRLGETVPKDECIFAIKPSIVAFLSGRISKAPPSVQADQALFEQGLRAEGCRYFYMLAFASPSYPVTMYPYQRLESRLNIIKPTLLQTTDGQLGVAGLFARLK